MTISILGARVIDPVSGLDQVTDLHLDGGRIAAIGAAPAGFSASRTIAADGLISHSALMELCCDFFNLNPPTRLRLREEILSGTVGALTSGKADLAIGVILEPSSAANLRAKPLGQVRFVYAVAPHHPLARAEEPLSDEELLKHRGIVVADSVQNGTTQSFGLLMGQEILELSSF